jgi:hypothetical protein
VQRQRYENAGTASAERSIDQTTRVGTWSGVGIALYYSANGEINHSTASAGYASHNYPFFLKDNNNVNLLNSKADRHPRKPELRGV